MQSRRFNCYIRHEFPVCVVYLACSYTEEYYTRLTLSFYTNSRCKPTKLYVSGFCEVSDCYYQTTFTTCKVVECEPSFIQLNGLFERVLNRRFSAREILSSKSSQSYPLTIKLPSGSISKSHIRFYEQAFPDKRGLKARNKGFKVTDNAQRNIVVIANHQSKCSMMYLKCPRQVRSSST